MADDDVYTLARGARDQDRLALLGRYYDAASQSWLRECGLSPGMRVLDVGCGHGNMTHFLARAVGASGHVTGVDVSEQQLGVAQSGSPHPERCTWLCAPADRLEDAAGGFDLVYCRLLLMHVHDPIAVLRAMRDALAREGRLVIETGIVSALRFVPARVGDDAWKSWWLRLGDAIGASYAFPDQTPIALRALGLRIEGMTSHQPVSFAREAKLLHPLGFEQVAPLYLEKAGASAHAIEAQRTAFAEHVADDETYVELYRMLQICARW